MKTLITLIALVLSPSVFSQTQKSSLVVLSGGFGSCKFNGDPSELQMWPYLKKTMLSKDQDSRPDVIRTCYAIGNGTTYWDFVSPEGDYQTSHSWNKGSFEKVKAVLEASIKNYRKVYFVGQSHGGYLAMVLQSHLNATHNQQVHLLTIDPISQRDCTPSVFSSSWFFWSPAPECTRFPRLSQQSLSTINKKTHNWMNFYQTQYDYLHSGPSLYADQDIHLKYDPAPTNAFGAHLATEFDLRVWKSLERSL